MDRLAAEMDDHHGPHAGRPTRPANVYGGCGPRLNEEVDAGRVARQARRPQGQAREREAAGRDRQLRRARQALGRGRELTRRTRPPAHPAAAARERTGTAGHEPRAARRHQARRRRAATSTRPTSTLAPEGFNVLLGATNAGKTTLIKLMAGLETPTTGEIWFRGRNVTGVIPRKRNVSLVHQFFINYPTMTRLREHRLAAARGGPVEGRDRPPRRRGGRAPAPDPDARPPAARALRRPAAAHRARPRHRQGQRPGAARRAARPTSTTSCARSCATSCPRSSPGAGRSSSTPPPSRTRR